MCVLTHHTYTVSYITVYRYVRSVCWLIAEDYHINSWITASKCVDLQNLGIWKEHQHHNNSFIEKKKLNTRKFYAIMYQHHDHDPDQPHWSSRRALVDNAQPISMRCQGQNAYKTKNPTYAVTQALFADTSPRIWGHTCAVDGTHHVKRCADRCLGHVKCVC